MSGPLGYVRYMATPLDHATWFFASAWGDVIVGIGVPIASAGLAAYLVIRQIRASNTTREIDRRAEAVAVLSEFVAENTSLALDQQRFHEAHLHRFKANAQLARSFGFLGSKNRVVGQWAAVEVAHITVMTDAWAARVEAEGTNPWVGEIGQERSEIARVGAEAIEALLHWMNEDISASWFKSNIRALPPSTKVASMPVR